MKDPEYAALSFGKYDGEELANAQENGRSDEGVIR